MWGLWLETGWEAEVKGVDVRGTRSSHLFWTSGVKNSDAFSGAYEKSGLKVLICCDTRQLGQYPATSMEREALGGSLLGAKPVMSPEPSSCLVVA